MTISDDVLTKFRRLQQMHIVASATAQGLREAVEHYRDSAQRETHAFHFAAKDWGDRVIVDEEGRAVRLTTVEKSAGNRNGVIREWSERRDVITELAEHAARLQSAQDKLTEARDQHEAAANRSARLHQALSEARQALRQRGWQETGR